MEVTLSVFGTFVRFVDMGSTWVNLLCYPFGPSRQGRPRAGGAVAVTCTVVRKMLGGKRLQFLLKCNLTPSLCLEILLKRDLGGAGEKNRRKVIRYVYCLVKAHYWVQNGNNFEMWEKERVP